MHNFLSEDVWVTFSSHPYFSEQYILVEDYKISSCVSATAYQQTFFTLFSQFGIANSIFLTFLIALKILVSALCFSLSNWMWNSVLLWSLIPPLEDPLHEVSTSHWFMPASKNYKWHCLETSQYDLGLTLEMYEAVEAICYQLYSLKEIS